MQYNTALGFLMSGLGLLCLTENRAWVARAWGILVTLVGTATLAEYALAIDLGIDELLMEHYIRVKTSHVGRMAPNLSVRLRFVSTAGVREPCTRSRSELPLR